MTEQSRSDDCGDSTKSMEATILPTHVYWEIGLIAIDVLVSVTTQ